MAGMGPAPKERPHRRNQPGFEELPAEGYRGKYPSLPATWTETVTRMVKTGDGEQEPVSEEVRFTYLQATRDWYDDHATSPQATKFVATDWRRLSMIAPLVDQFHRSPSEKLAKELRLQETTLGATVMDRRRMRMNVASPQAARGKAPVVSLASLRDRLRE